MTLASAPSVPELQRALQADPADWQTALLLKRALADAHLYAEADPAFRAARARFPDDVWLAHMSRLYAYPWADLPAMTQRARLLAAESPTDPATVRLLGALLQQGRDYAGAAAAYAQAGTDVCRGLAEEARRYIALGAVLAVAPSDGPMPAIAMINLDRNTERLAETTAQFAGCDMPRFRVPGVDGSRLPAAAARRLGGSARQRGTLGCFLSHAAAWEAVLARGLSACLVIEDDTMPLLDLPRSWGALGLPERFDVCFVNDRICPPASADRFTAMPLSQAMLAFPSWRNAPGADGYVVSDEGARRLLAYVARDGFGDDVDWRMLAYALPENETEAWPEDSHARQHLRQLRPALAPEHRLSAWAICPPLIRTVPIASDREDADRAAG